ncbi:MAG: DNA polymerase III subunit delta [Betaproteobacteria bacterium]|nr:DNA polymerase III subunit delta [Betaproteobacteria bacterium]MBI3936274.1 DNA polymerase III subunit delta [Betaproteobacteria bacterium]
MRINSEQLPQQLARGLAALYTMFGGEPLLALEAGDRVRAAARAGGYTEREVLTVDPGFKWGELAMSGRSQSLFGAKKILELRIPGGKPGREGAEALTAYCAAPPADTITLIYLPALDWRTQKAGWFAALERAGVAVEAKAVPRGAVPQWLAGRLAAQGQEADRETLDFIADRVEGNLLAAYQEVQKLALLFPPGKLAFEQVKEAVLDVARYDVFQVGEALLAGDAARLARTLDGLRGEGAAPPLVLWAMAEEIRAIGKVVTGIASGKPLSMLWREARVWGAAHQTLMQQNAKRFTLAQLAEALRHAAAIDFTIKGLARGDVWVELLQLGLRFTRGSANAPVKRGRMAKLSAASQEAGQQTLF